MGRAPRLRVARQRARARARRRARRAARPHQGGPAADLPATVGAKKSTSPSFGTEVLPLREMQRRYVSWAYAELGSRKLLTAEKLGIDDKTLAKWLAREPDGEGE